MQTTPPKSHSNRISKHVRNCFIQKVIKTACLIQKKNFEPASPTKVFETAFTHLCRTPPWQNSSFFFNPSNTGSPSWKAAPSGRSKFRRPMTLTETKHGFPGGFIIFAGKSLTYFLVDKTLNNQTFFFGGGVWQSFWCPSVKLVGVCG